MAEFFAVAWLFGGDGEKKTACVWNSSPGRLEEQNSIFTHFSNAAGRLGEMLSNSECCSILLNSRRRRLGSERCSNPKAIKMLVALAFKTKTCSDKLDIADVWLLQ